LKGTAKGSHNLAKANPWDDHFTRRARDEKWLARSIYKLEEIDRKYKLLKPGFQILDLGCCPGSWSQYCLRKVGLKGDVIGVDQSDGVPVTAPNFRYIQRDILTLEPSRLLDEISPRDVVLSDLAPRTTGIRVTDESRSMELARKALSISLIVGKRGGHFLCKVFEGQAVAAFKKDLSATFSQVRTSRPTAVRKHSREVYLVGLGKKDGEFDPLG
jgi:23S rRNA (uridine2552-2'-O)-methyltransferase